MEHHDTNSAEGSILIAVIGWITAFWTDLAWFAAEAGKAAVFGFLGAAGAILAKAAYKKWFKKYLE